MVRRPFGGRRPAPPSEGEALTTILLPIAVCTAGLPHVLDRADGWITSRARVYVCFANVHVLEASRSDPRLLDALQAADLVLPDGLPVAWLAGRADGRRADRIPGATFFEAVCARDIGRRRHFLYGSTEETLCRLREALRTRFPGIEICGSEAPPFRSLTEPEREAAYARINSTNPDVVWIGLGAPKQELWMQAARHHLDAPVLAGVGAAFDFVSGAKARAPGWMQNAGLEWFHRMVIEPRRLTGRYVKTNLTFSARVVRALARDYFHRGEA